MTGPSSKKADTYLEAGNQDLRFIFAKIKELEILNKKVATYLDEGIVNYCQVANLVGNKLILLVADGSIATLLRFQTADLLKKFKQDPDLQKIRDIQCKVRPQQPRTLGLKTSKTAQPMALLSPETAEMIRHIAESLEDPALKAALLKIAAHTEKN